MMSPRLDQGYDQTQAHGEREQALVRLYTTLYARYVNQPRRDQAMVVTEPCPMCGGLLTFTFPTLSCTGCAFTIEA
jgi:hypothetical protein